MPDLLMMGIGCETAMRAGQVISNSYSVMAGITFTSNSTNRMSSGLSIDLNVTNELNMPADEGVKLTLTRLSSVSPAPMLIILSPWN